MHVACCGLDRVPEESYYCDDCKGKATYEGLEDAEKRGVAHWARSMAHDPDHRLGGLVHHSGRACSGDLLLLLLLLPSLISAPVNTDRTIQSVSEILHLKLVLHMNETVSRFRGPM